jgi:penicillin-binding protein 1A
VRLDQVAPPLRDAVVAIEDSRFFDHEGVDPRGILRALTRDVGSGSADEGGSTITQQYVRAVMLDGDKSIDRKLREAVRAVQVERKYTKQQILERYLNTVYFGNGAYGVEAAAQLYFAKPAKDLDLAQSALLAGLIQSPNRTDPYREPAAAQRRRDVVLDRMVDVGRADAAAVAAAKASPLGVGGKPPPDRSAAGHFVQQVKDFVTNTPAFGPDHAARERLLFTGGLRIQTTLDPHLQQLAEQAVTQVLPDPATDPEAALVSIDPTTGHVLAYVGGRDFFGSSPSAQFDLAQNALGRSSGSAFKPFVLAAALDADIPLSRVYDAPSQLTIPVPGQDAPWEVHNFEESGGGAMNLTEATVESVNTVYAQLIMDVGPDAAVATANRLGIRSKLQANPAAVLGTNGVTALDMASAYSSFAGDGLHPDPVIVTRVTTRRGKVLYEAPAARHRVLSPLTSREVTDVLQQVVTRGTGVNARIGRQVAGKTGTAEDYSDAWFTGYTPEMSTAVWVGFPDRTRSMTPPTTRITVTGGTWPAEIWQLYQGAALAGTPASAFPSVEDARAAADAGAEGSTTTTRAAPRLPSVVGMREADARRILASVGANVETAVQSSRDYPPGVVLAQSPAAGRPLHDELTVTITLAVAPRPQVAVPALLGLTPDEARVLLAARGLTLAVTEEAEPPPGDPARSGRIWKQNPLGRGTVDEGGTVDVRVNPTG